MYYNVLACPDQTRCSLGLETGIASHIWTLKEVGRHVGTQARLLAGIQENPRSA